MSTTNIRQHVHSLIDQLPPTQLNALAGLLESMVHPLSAALANAPVDDEGVTEEEAAAIRRSQEWFRHNKGISIEEIMAEFGLSLKDFPPDRHSDQH